MTKEGDQLLIYSNEIIKFLDNQKLTLNEKIAVLAITSNTVNNNFVLNYLKGLGIEELNEENQKAFLLKLRQLSGELKDG